MPQIQALFLAILAHQSQNPRNPLYLSKSIPIREDLMRNRVIYSIILFTIHRYSHNIYRNGRRIDILAYRSQMERRWSGDGSWGTRNWRDIGIEGNHNNKEPPILPLSHSPTRSGIARERVDLIDGLEGATLGLIRKSQQTNEAPRAWSPLIEDGSWRGANKMVCIAFLISSIINS